MESEQASNTLRGVTERLGRLTAAAQAAPPPEADLVREAEELLQAFERTEALHVSLALRQGSFPFASAQEQLRSQRLAFSSLISRLRAESVREERLTRRLARAEALARRAPLTSPQELELIRAERRARLQAV